MPVAAAHGAEPSNLPPTPLPCHPPPLPQIIPGTETYRYNFWGYSTVGYFAPMARFSAAAASGGGGTDVLNEFKQMVKVRACGALVAGRLLGEDRGGQGCAAGVVHSRMGMQQWYSTVFGGMADVQIVQPGLG